jgi:hypothetical protein
MAQSRAVASIGHKEGTLKKSLVAMLALGICVMASQNAMAEPHLGLQSAGFQAGMVNPENLRRWGTLTPNIRLASHLDYWSKSGDHGHRQAAADIAVNGPITVPGLVGEVSPYAGVGMGLHFRMRRSKSPASDIEDGTAVGFDSVVASRHDHP